MEAIAHPAIPDELCTLQTCSLLQAHFRYLPSLAGNALYLAIFAVLIVPQVVLGIQYKTWGFMGAMLGGLILEVIGYTARVQMHSNPFSQDPFLMYAYAFPSFPAALPLRPTLTLRVTNPEPRYIVTLTIGPAFFAAAIYLCLGRIVMVFGEHISRFRPRTYTFTFISFDFLSLIFQAVGGALASAANTPSALQTGVDVMLAGLGIQVVSMSLFIALCGEFAWKVSHNKHDLEPAHADLRASKLWKFFLFGMRPFE